MSPPSGEPGRDPHPKPNRTLEIPKPNFSLSTIRESDPEAHESMDHEYSAYQDRVSAELNDQLQTTSGHDDDNVQDMASPARSTGSGLTSLDGLLIEKGIDAATSEGMDEFHRRLTALPYDQRLLDQTDANTSHMGHSSVRSSDSDQTVKPGERAIGKLPMRERGLSQGNEDDPFVSKTETSNAGFKLSIPGVHSRTTGEKPAHKIEPASRTQIRATQRTVKITESILHGPPSSMYALANLLTNINGYLDQLEAEDSGPRIIEPPQIPLIKNPLLQSSGTVLIQCNSGTCYKVHKMLLCMHSPQHYAHSHANPAKGVYELDTDEKTLDIFVDWLYHRNFETTKKKKNYKKGAKATEVDEAETARNIEEEEKQEAEERNVLDLNRFTTDQLLELITVSLVMRIARLYNAALTALFRQHMNLDDLRSARLRKFRASGGALRKLYRESGELSPARKAVGLLVAKSDKPDPKGIVGWQLEMARDVEWVAETVRTKGWEAIDVDEMFCMYLWKGILIQLLYLNLWDDEICSVSEWIDVEAVAAYRDEEGGSVWWGARTCCEPD
ncbi:hypothetical protein K491DRAFT_678316 [Lophiostoma macrostomum CBS 122681]|uniref:BTB domain-containing protein n=1 Tax=Lophiostoma macrostomum CBS 122681 TaxID=1314788 RepID=A0A6A6T8X2_9PLEO|nr:hypothetical protein K491DRAFT_678316 [Lophiostoma macrostomum CBS 122681]